MKDILAFTRACAHHAPGIRVLFRMCAHLHARLVDTAIYMDARMYVCACMTHACDAMHLHHPGSSYCQTHQKADSTVELPFQQEVSN